MRATKIHEFEEWVVGNVVRSWEEEGVAKDKIAKLSGFSLSSIYVYCNAYKDNKRVKQHNLADTFLYKKWSRWTCPQ